MSQSISFPQTNHPSDTFSSDTSGNFLQEETDSFDDAAKYLEDALSGKLRYFSLGWGTGVDNRTFGIERENLVVVGGDYKHGKTIHSLNTVAANLEQGHTVLVVPTEISRKKYIVRLAAREVRVSLRSIVERTLSPDQQKQLFKAVYSLRSRPIEIYDHGCPKLRDVEKAVEVYSPDLLVVDHLQHLDPEDASPAAGYKRVTQGLKKLAVDHNIGVLLLTQVTFSEGWFQVNDRGRYEYDLSKMSTSWSRAPLAEGDKILFLHNLSRDLPGHYGKGGIIYHSLRDYESGGYDVIPVDYQLQRVGDYASEQKRTNGNNNPY